MIWDQRLSDIAYAHSADMIVRDFFDHVNPDGQEPTGRIHRQHRQFIGNTGENLSILVASPPFSPTLVSDEAVNGWLKSPPHRANLLDRAFTHVGIGVAIGSLEAKVTQDFMEVRGILREPVPVSLAHGEKLELDVIPFPKGNAKAEKYILAPVRPGTEHPDPPVWDMSTRHPSVAPGSYTIQFCFPKTPISIPRSLFRSPDRDLG